MTDAQIDPERDAMFSADDPFALFAAWLEEARASEPNDPGAMALATVDAQGMPDVRIVLLKHAGADGFVFYTNRDSAKGLELAANPKAALVLHWKSLRRQVRVRGPVRLASDAMSDAYFASRSRASRISALASDQSRPLGSRAELEARAAALAERYADSEPPRPAHWGGYVVTPLSIEFWRDGAHRLHDRRRFSRTAEGAAWTTERLNP
jgi:pyridoxamine 5'-phosphate oxidase